MERVAKEVFFKNVEDEYKVLLKTAASSVHLNRITSNSPSSDLQNITFDILKDLWPKKTFVVNPDSPGRKLEHVSMSIPEGSELIGNGFRQSSSSNEVTISHVEYSLETKGDKSSLDYTVKYNKRELPISFSSDKLLIHFYFQDEPKNVAETIQIRKNQFVELINNNQKDVEEFFTSHQDSFLAHIRLVVDNKFAEKKKLSDDTNLF